MYVKFIKDDKVVEEVSISPEIIPLPTDIVVLEAGKFTVESREYDILGGTCSVILDQQITWAVKHVKDSAKCGLKEAKDFVDTYCDYVRND